MAAEPARRAGRAALDSIVAAARRVEMVRGVWRADGVQSASQGGSFAYEVKVHSFGLGSGGRRPHVTDALQLNS